MSNRSGVVLGVLLAAIALVPAAGWADVQSGVAMYHDGQKVTFPRAFPRVPAVVVSGHRDGQPLVVAAAAISKTGFTLGVRDLAGGRVSADGWIQWVAATDGDGVRAGQARCDDKARVAISSPLPGSVVLASGERSGMPFLVSAGSSSPTGFQVAVASASGGPAQGVTVQWIAVSPRPQWRCGTERGDDGQALSFQPLPATPVIVVSAQGGGEALAAAAVDNSRTGCRLAIAKPLKQMLGLKHGVERAKQATVHFWALPAGLAGGAEPPAARADIQAGIAPYGDGQRVDFQREFDSVPTVVASGHLDREALVVRPSGVTKKGFVLKIFDLAGQRVPSGAWVQWIAASEGESVRTGQTRCDDGERVSFSTPLPGSVVLATGERGREPCLVAALNTGPTGFTVEATGIDGSRAEKVLVNWIAVAPRPEWRCGVGQFDDGQQLAFQAMRSTPVIVVSGQQGGGALAVGAADNARSGATLTIRKAGRRLLGLQKTEHPVKRAWVQYWAVPSGAAAAIALAPPPPPIVPPHHPPEHPPQHPQEAAGVIQAGIGTFGDGQRVTFSEAFRANPAVVASGQRGGRAVMVAAANVTRAGFVLKIRDLTGSPIDSGAWVQWVAATDGPGIRTGQTRCSHRDWVALSAPLPGATILTGGERAGQPYLVCALNNSPTGFTVAATGADGGPGRDITVQWIGIAPGPEWRCGIVQASDGQQLAFQAMPATPVILASGQLGGEAVAVGSVNNSDTGCTLTIRKPAPRLLGLERTDAPVAHAWIQFLALPAGIIEAGAQPPTVVQAGVPAQTRPAPALQAGIATCGDGQSVSFPEPFDSVPVVVVSVQAGGEAVIAAPAAATRTGFSMKIRDLSGNRVAAGAWVQWVATTGGEGILAGKARCDHGGRIDFPSQLPGATILASAERGGAPYLACAVNSAPTGFTVAIAASDGSQGRGVTLSWIAVAPRPEWRCGVLQCDDGKQLFFPAMPVTPVIVLAAQQWAGPLAAAPLNNMTSGCRLSIRRPVRGMLGLQRGDAPVEQAWTHFWALPAGVAAWSGTQPPGTTAQPQAAVSSIQAGIGWLADGQEIAFPCTFRGTPTVVVSGQANGEAVAAAATAISKTGFKLALRDVAGRPVTAQAWVQWVAATPGEGVRVGRATCSDGQHVRISPPLPGCTILASGERQGVPQLACAGNNAPDGFDIALCEPGGAPAKGVRVEWIAIEPRPEWRCGATQLDDGQQLAFEPMADTPVIVTSAQLGGPLASAAVENAQAGCRLSLNRPGVRHALGIPLPQAAVRRAWVQFWALPATAPAGGALAQGGAVQPQDGPAQPQDGGQPSVEVMPGVQSSAGLFGDGQQVAFSRPFRAVPLVVAYGQGGGRAATVSAANISNSGFTLSIRDDRGQPIPAGVWVVWIAAMPEDALRIGQVNLPGGQPVQLVPPDAVRKLDEWRAVWDSVSDQLRDESEGKKP